MKKIILLLGIVLMNVGVYAQCINGKKTTPIYQDGAYLVEELDAQGKEIVRLEYDLLFSSKETYRSLSTGWTYTIGVFGDEGVKDLDLKLYEWDEIAGLWVLVISDNSSADYARFEFTPKITALYKIEVIAYKFHTGYTVCRYGLIIYHD